MEEYIKKVCLIAKAKYNIEREIVLSFSYEIGICYQQGFTPRRTVEVVANKVFGVDKT